MLIANSLDLWQRNAFFSASVEVQQSPDVFFHCPLLRMDLLSLLFEVPFFHHVAIRFFFWSAKSLFHFIFYFFKIVSQL